LRKIAFVLAVVAAFCTAFASSASALPIHFNLKVQHTQKCLDVPSAANSTAARQWSCLGKDQMSQLFTLDPVSDGSVRIKSIQGFDTCLDVLGANTNQGATVGVYDCIPGQKNQEWTFVYSGAGNYEIRSKLNGKCLDVDTFGGGTANGVRVQMWTCLSNPALNQRWNLASI
jgi:hypothetical protein